MNEGTFYFRKQRKRIDRVDEKAVKSETAIPSKNVSDAFFLYWTGGKKPINFQGIYNIERDSQGSLLQACRAPTEDRSRQVVCHFHEQRQKKKSTRQTWLHRTKDVREQENDMARGTVRSPPWFLPFPS